MAESWSFDTLKLRAGYDPVSHSQSVTVGDVRSLILKASNTIHRKLTKSEQRRADIAPETIRLSRGLEDPADLLANLEQVFVKTQNACCN